MTPTQALYPTIAVDYEDEIQNTRKLLELVPLDDARRGYKPHPKSMSLEALASHVAEAPGWTKILFQGDVFEMQPDYKPRIATSTAELLKMFDEAAEQGRNALDGASDAVMQKNWTFKFGDTSMKNSRTKWARSFINHMIHHRAQLGVYLRLNGIPIPGMYGPSADEA
jgi:uncharacterized damage-inducible protein DinB